MATYKIVNQVNIRPIASMNSEAVGSLEVNQLVNVVDQQAIQETIGDTSYTIVFLQLQGGGWIPESLEYTGKTYAVAQDASAKPAFIIFRDDDGSEETYVRQT